MKQMKDLDRPRLNISFSGGRTSAVMLKRCLERYRDKEICITFANTGCEHENTLKFVDEVDKHWAGRQINWLEAEIHGPGKGPTAKIVSYETASRNGEPFEAAIRKHGVFCSTHPNCTARLKVEPMESFLRKQMGWERKTYYTAVGIRSDEADRISMAAKKNGIIYPLIDEGWTRQNVEDYMARYPWDLDLPSTAWGNCVWCWKKSKRKLMTLAKQDPSIFDFPARMEKEYGHISKTKKDEGQRENRTFFRGRQSAEDILRDASTTVFEPFADERSLQPGLFDETLDVGQGCSESCEIGADE